MRTNVKKISEVWDEFAQKYGEDRRASTPDAYLIDLEIRTLIKHIIDGETILDIGCGNGYAEFKIAQKKKVNIVGVDISKDMLAQAKKIQNKYANKLKGTMQFKFGNILSKRFSEGLGINCFDVVLTKRTLINILNWKEQKDSIITIWHLLKPNGRFIMMEATVQGHNRINELRNRFGISSTPVRWHNNYLDEDKLLPFLGERFESVFYKDFSSTYYIGSRLIQPLFLKPFKKEPSYDSLINWLFSYLPSCGNFGIQKIFIGRRKEL